MVNSIGLMILCLVRLARAEDRISVDTVGTITATAGYSISDNSHSPTAVTTSLLQTSSSTDFLVAGRDSSKDESSSSGSSDETYTAPVPELRHNSQSLALRSRQARGKANGNAQWHHDRGSVEDKDVAAEMTPFPYTDHRINEQLYNVKPQTFSTDHQSSSSGAKSGESVEKSVPYGKKMQKNGGGFDDEQDDRRPVFDNWSEEVHGERPSRSRKKNKSQLDAATSQEKRRPQMNAIAAANNVAENDKDGWREVSPNMEIATGYSATVQHLHESSQEASGSSESLSAHPIIYHSDSGNGDDSGNGSDGGRSGSGGGGGGGGISSIENVAQTEPQNFNHKQVLSKMNHFDFSNAVSPTNKTPALREKRLNYQPGGNVLQQSPPVRYAFSGGGGVGGQPLKALQVPSSTASVKSVKIEHSTPNYHNIVVPMPVSHQMYTAIGSSDIVHGHQLASSTMQQAMMSLPVVHNVFFKTDEHGGGKTMPAIVIPLKPEYLQQLQHQQYLHAVRADAEVDSQNAAGHQRPVHVSGDTGTKTFHYQQQQLQQQQQQQQQQQPATVAYQQQKTKSSKVKKPFGPIKDDRVKQPFNLHQHQFYNVPFPAGHLQHGSLPNHGGHHVQQHDRDPSDDSPRYGQATGASSAHAYPAAVGHSLVVKRPHAYGYTPSAKYKSPQQQQMSSAEEVAAAVVQHNVQPYRATTYHPGFAYLNGPDDDYPYRPIYKDMKKRNDVLVVRTNRRK